MAHSSTEAGGAAARLRDAAGRGVPPLSSTSIRDDGRLDPEPHPTHPGARPTGQPVAAPTACDMDEFSILNERRRVRTVVTAALTAAAPATPAPAPPTALTHSSKGN